MENHTALLEQKKGYRKREGGDAKKEREDDETNLFSKPALPVGSLMKRRKDE